MVFHNQKGKSCIAKRERGRGLTRMLCQGIIDKALNHKRGKGGGQIKSNSNLTSYHVSYFGVHNFQ